MAMETAEETNQRQIQMVIERMVMDQEITVHQTIRGAY